MRTLLATAFFLGFGGLLAAADDKLDTKFLVGKWAITDVGVKTDGKVEKSIEFKANGTYAMSDRGTKTGGTFKLKGTTLDLSDKGSGAVITWKDLAIKDGKITRPLRGKALVEMTRIVEEKKDKK